MVIPNLRDDGRRWHRAGQTAAAQIAARVATGICVLIQTPLLLHHLGTESFGWLMAVAAFAGLSQFADLGAAIALQQQLAVAWGSGDDDALVRIFEGGRRLLWRLAASCVIPGMALGLLLGPRFLPAPDGSRELASWFVVAISVAVGLRFSAGPRLAAAVQAGWISAGWIAACNVLALGAVVIGTMANAAPAVFVAIVVAAQAVPGAFTELHMKRRLGWRLGAPASSGVDKAVGSIWREGLHYAFPNLAGAALQVFMPAAFARFGGYAASTAFSILQKLFGLVVQGNALVLAPLWPAYAEAEATGNRAWVKRSFALSLAFTFACIAALALGSTEMPLLERLWLGVNAPRIAPSLVWLIALWSAASLANQTLSYLLLGLSALTRIATGVGFAHIATLGAMLIGGFAWGVTGVASGLACGCLLVASPQYIRCVRHRLSS